MLQIRNISKNFGKIRALDGVSFDLAPGRVTGFVGANGAGKSTLFRILAGQFLPDTGDALLHGVSLIDYPDRCAGRLGFLPDHPASDRFTTVSDLLDTTARLHGYCGDALKKHLADLIAFTAVDEILRQPLSALSSGQRQRAALAQVLIGRPEILLLDEPAAGLDPRARIELYRILRELRTNGQTVLISSHILSELDEICDDLVIIERGRIVRCEPLTGRAPAAELTLIFDGPAEPFRAVITAMPQVTAVEISGSRIRITATSPESVSPLLEQCFRACLPIVSMQRGEHRIADLYLDTMEKTP